jgi:sugar transferase (PEP-CTERM system associated)
MIPFPLLLLLLLVDALCIVVALLLTGLFALPAGMVTWQEYTGASGMTLIFYLLCFYILDAYKAGLEDFKDTIGRMASACVLGCVASSTATYVMEYSRFSKTALVLLAVLVLLICLMWRYIYYRTALRWSTPRRVLLLGEDKAGVVREFLSEGITRTVIVGYVGEQGNHADAGPYLGNPFETLRVAREQDASVIVVLPDAPLDDSLAKELLNAKLAGILVVDIRLLCEHVVQRLPLAQLSEEWLLLNEGFSLNTHGSLRRLKRVMDVALALCLLLLSCPFMLLIALLITLESPGPIIYKQKRVGLNGCLFTLYKFRSMYEDAEAEGRALWARADDSRVTRVGACIRKVRLDELPQVWNVLAGSMSFIGPRPERPYFVHSLTESIPFYSLRHSIKPGLTGWAQVCYPYGASQEDARRKLEYDLYYIKNMSVLLDIRITLKTLGVVLFPRGAR